MTKADLEAKLVDVMETCERLSAAIERVRALHDQLDGFCCEDGGAWPCPTFRALRSEEGPLVGAMRERGAIREEPTDDV